MCFLINTHHGTVMKLGVRASFDWLYMRVYKIRCLFLWPMSRMSFPSHRLWGCILYPTIPLIVPCVSPSPAPQALPSILGDDRFKVMFENPDYQVDEQSEEFRLLNPIVSKVGQKRKKKLRLLAQQVAASQQVTLESWFWFQVFKEARSLKDISLDEPFWTRPLWQPKQFLRRMKWLFWAGVEWCN